MAGEGPTAPAAVRPSPRRPQPVPVRQLLALAAFWAVAIVWVTALLAGSDPASTGSQLIGSVAILAAILFCLVACVLVARRRTPARLSWTLIAVGMGWAPSVSSATWSPRCRPSQTAPSTLGDTLAFLGYFLPTVTAIFAFPRRAELLISRFRQVLDALVITIGVLVISEATVLGAVLELTDTTTLAGWLHLAYLVADIAICALVLCIGMRQLPGDRLTWFFLGSGLLVVAVSDSIYVRLLADGATNLTATPLAAGWMLGPVLIGLATVVPMTGRRPADRDYTVLLQLLPYVPVVGSLVVLGLGAGENDPFLLITGALLLVVLMIRQVMIVYENVSLTRDLEGKVAARTAELDHSRLDRHLLERRHRRRFPGQQDHGLEPGRGEALPTPGRRRASDARRTCCREGSCRRDVGAAAPGRARRGARTPTRWTGAAGRTARCPVAHDRLADPRRRRGAGDLDLRPGHHRAASCRRGSGAGPRGRARVLAAEVGVPGHHEPRDPDADERRDRTDRPAAATPSSTTPAARCTPKACRAPARRCSR